MKTFVLMALGATSHFARAAIHFTYAKEQRSNTPSANSNRRSVKENISYNSATYVVNVTVGTPGQAMTLELSTTSADTFVIDARSFDCTYYTDYNDNDDGLSYEVNNYCTWRTFSPGNSSSCVLTETTSDDDSYSSYDGDFSTSYNGDTTAYGDYMTDVLTIEGMTIPNLTMGLVNDTSSYIGGYTYMGVLGIGYNDSSTDSFPGRLLEQGLINTTAYSIWVDDDTAASGNLLFGAIDTTKFTGNLTRLRSSYSYIETRVQVVGINGTSKSGGPVPITMSADDESASGEVVSETDGDSYLFSATFSPPDTLSTLPSDVASQIWEMAGAYYHEDLELAVIGCSAASDTATNFTMQLGGQGPDGPIITTYMSDLVIPVHEFNLPVQSSYYVDLDGDVCLFGVQNASALGYSYSYGYSDSSQYNLGSTMLRRTYSVFDLANSEVAVAPVVFGASATSNVVPFSSYGATVPSSTIVCYYSDCYADAGTNNDDGEDADADSSDGGLRGVLSLGALIGLSLGLGLGCFALGLIGFLVWRHRRNKSMATKEGSVSSAEAGQPAPEMSTANAGQRSAPEMAQAAPTTTSVETAPSERLDKGKGPEVAPSLPPRRVEEVPGISNAAEASTTQSPQRVEHE